MKAIDLIQKAKITLQRTNPFFSIMSLYLKPKEYKDMLKKENGGIGVDIKGNLYYDKDYIETHSNIELTGLLSHEILHLILLDFERQKERDKELWNISTDIIINTILLQNNFKLKNGLKPTSDYYGNYSFKINDKLTIENLEKKNAEQVYNEIYNKLTKEEKESLNNKRKEKHIYIDGEGKDGEGKDGEGKDGEGKISKKEIGELKASWKDKINNAIVISKMRGNIPKGMGLIFDNLYKHKIKWKEKLKRYIKNEIPYNQTYTKPHFKSRSAGYYMPSYDKEKINIVVGIDTSGSVSQEELTEFMSEVKGINQEFSGRIEIRILTHDTIIHDNYLLKNNIDKKIKTLKLNGRGGTSHKDLIETINKNYKDTKILICFTDGYSDIEDINFLRNKFNTLFVINKNGTDNFKSNISKIRTEIIKLE